MRMSDEQMRKQEDSGWNNEDFHLVSGASIEAEKNDTEADIEHVQVMRQENAKSQKNPEKLET